MLASVLLSCSLLLLLLSSSLAARQMSEEQRLKQKCTKECNDLRYEVLTMEICRLVLIYIDKDRDRDRDRDRDICVSMMSIYSITVARGLDR